MRKLFSAFSIWIILQSVISQNIAITDDDSYTGNSSAMLDVKSTTKGFLPPRMTNSEILAINSPATGLIVFNTNLNKPIYYNGSSWYKFNDSIVNIGIVATVNDYDGNVYETVLIGNQVWMAENLKTTHYSNGIAIPAFVTDNTVWAQLTTPGYCYYNDDSVTYGTLYGIMYNWYAVDTGSNGNENLCPIDWHVPSDDEWTVLANYLGGSSVAGGKLKEIGTTHWTSPNAGATNETGFTAFLVACVSGMVHSVALAISTICGVLPQTIRMTFGIEG